MGEGIAMRIGRFPDRTLFSTRLDLETQPCYKTAGDLRAKIVENAMINIGLVRLSPREWPKVGRGTAK